MFSLVLTSKVSKGDDHAGDLTPAEGDGEGMQTEAGTMIITLSVRLLVYCGVWR